MAAILAYADLHDDAAAAKRFRCSTKTISRRRKAAGDGREPDLAQLVQAAKTKAAERHGDLLESALEATLKRIVKLAPKATMTEAVQAAEALGSIRIERDLFGGGDASTAHSRKDSAARAAARSAGGAESPSADSPVH